MANEAVLQYYDSKFLGPISAQDQLEEFKQTLKDVKKSNLQLY